MVNESGVKLTMLFKVMLFLLMSPTHLNHVMHPIGLDGGEIFE